MTESRAEVFWILLFPQVIMRGRASDLLAPLTILTSNKSNESLASLLHILNTRQKRRLLSRRGLQIFQIKERINRHCCASRKNTKPGEHGARDLALPHKGEKLGVESNFVENSLVSEVSG